MHARRRSDILRAHPDIRALSASPEWRTKYMCAILVGPARRAAPRRRAAAAAARRPARPRGTQARATSSAATAPKKARAHGAARARVTLFFFSLSRTRGRECARSSCACRAPCRRRRTGPCATTPGGTRTTRRATGRSTPSRRRGATPTPRAARACAASRASCKRGRARCSRCSASRPRSCACASRRRGTRATPAGGCAIAIAQCVVGHVDAPHARALLGPDASGHADQTGRPCRTSPRPCSSKPRCRASGSGSTRACISVPPGRSGR